MLQHRVSAPFTALGRFDTLRTRYENAFEGPMND